ncbi:MAG: Diaminopimelate epimerase [Acidimicrobiales bacterium]|nr:Diaminopimelate epimerase [Acidimicrobiales bacterium]
MYQSLGNSFLFLFDDAGDAVVDGSDARAWCRAAAADGLIRARHGTGAVDLVMRLWNSDGSLAEISGNGLRCLGRAAVDAGWVPERDLVVATDAGTRRVSFGAGGVVSAEMGQPKVGDGGHVDVGNPHLVLDDEDQDLAALGAAHPDLNVELFRVGPGGDAVTMRVWERGAGETQACGSGACAVAAVARARGLVGTIVTVHQPGGPATVELRPDGTALLSGPVEHLGPVEVPVA